MRWFFLSSLFGTQYGVSDAESTLSKYRLMVTSQRNTTYDVIGSISKLVLADDFFMYRMRNFKRQQLLNE